MSTCSRRSKGAVRLVVVASVVLVAGVLSSATAAAGNGDGDPRLLQLSDVPKGMELQSRPDSEKSAVGVPDLDDCKVRGGTRLDVEDSTAYDVRYHDDDPRGADVVEAIRDFETAGDAKTYFGARAKFVKAAAKCDSLVEVIGETKIDNGKIHLLQLPELGDARIASTATGPNEKRPTGCVAYVRDGTTVLQVQHHDPGGLDTKTCVALARKAAARLDA